MSDTNKVRFGLKNVHYALLTEESGTVTYGEPVAWPGAKSITLDPEGDTSTYYADDMAYYSTNSNNGYTGTLEMSYLPEDVKKAIFNNITTKDGLLAEDANELPSNVALMFEFSGDKKATKHIFYRVVFARPSIEGETKEDTVDPKTTSMDITCIPVEKDGHAWVKADCFSGTSLYDTFYTTTPTLPTATDANTVSEDTTQKPVVDSTDDTTSTTDDGTEVITY